jgi:Flp pilus assembly protein TadG
MLRKVARARLKHAAAAFASANGGNIAMIFGLTLVPTLFMAGAAVDYSGAASLKTKLQRGTDGAVIQLCKLPGTSSQAEIEAAAQKSLSAYMEGKPFRIDSVVPTTRPRQIELTTSADFPTAIVRAVNAGFANVPVRAASRCFSEQQTFEIALVLDTTGSMLSSSGGVSKLQAMKTAAKNFVNAIFTDPTMMGHTKMSLVPFAASVALPTSTRTASWADTNGQASYHWNFVQGGAATAAGFASPGSGAASRSWTTSRPGMRAGETGQGASSPGRTHST